MNRAGKLPQTLKAALAALICLILLCGCGCGESGPGELSTGAQTSQPAGERTLEPTEKPVTSEPTEKPVTPEPATLPPHEAIAPLYRLDYSIIPAAIIPKLTNADIEAYFAVINAYARYGTEITVEARDGIENLYELLELCFPVFYSDVYDSCFIIDGNTVRWSYSVGEEAHYRLIEEFEARVLKALEPVLEGEARDASEIMRALTIYQGLTINVHYDYSSQDYYNGEIELDEKDYMNHSYDALTSGRGVCWCYARAYAFLLNHIGMEAITVSCDGGIGHHEWTMFRYDGRWFFADPTWDMGGGLSYFAVNESNRLKNGYRTENMRYFAGADYPLRGDFSVNDGRFLPITRNDYGELKSYRLEYSTNRIMLSYTSFGLGKRKTVYFNLDTFALEE